MLRALNGKAQQCNQFNRFSLYYMLFASMANNNKTEEEKTELYLTFSRSYGSAQYSVQIRTMIFVCLTNTLINHKKIYDK